MAKGDDEDDDTRHARAVHASVPRCAECGRKMHPKSPVFPARDDVRLTLAGIYCSADCALEADERGWPKWRARYGLTKPPVLSLDGVDDVTTT